MDIVAHNDPLGTSSPRIKVQVKRRQDKVSVEELRSFLAILGDQDVGIFVSLGGFTADAGAAARGQEKKRISLMELGKLFDLWVENYSKIPEKYRGLLPLRAVYFLDSKI
jgi:restriction system protein